MFTSFRHYRQFYNRRLSVILAVAIGLILGMGAFLLWQRAALLPDKAEKAAVPDTEANAAVPAQKSPSITAADLAAHKSLYAVSLARAHTGSQIIDVEGKMFYETKKNCDTLITDHRFYLTYDYADSAPLRVTSDFSTAEQVKGGHFSFSSRRRRDGDLYQELRGSATLETPAGGKKGGVATYALPDGIRFDLGPETLFPAAHTAALIRAAMSGKKFFSATLFDGSDEEGPVDVTAVIGTPLRTLDDLKSTKKYKENKAIDLSLLAFPAWPVRLAFFPIKQGADTADYELSMILHKNGVISDMTIDYDDFSVRQLLTALQPLRAETCTPQEEAEAEDKPGAPLLPTPPLPKLPAR